MAIQGARWQLREPTGPPHCHPPPVCQTPPQESRALALRAAIHLNRSSLLRASAALAALAATCGALTGSRHYRKNSTRIISCNPTPAAARGGPTIIIPTFQMKKSGGAQAGVGKTELSVLPWPGFQSRERGVAAPVLPAAASACQPWWDIKRFVSFLSINQY